MQTVDLPAVLRLQAEAYPEDYLESLQAYQRKLTVYPEGCFVARQVNQLGGYLVAVPICFRQPPFLNAVHRQSVPGSDTLHLHDLAVSARARGQGIASRLICEFIRVWEQSEFRCATLIAVQGSQPFWERQGFAVDCGLQPSQTMAWGYGVDAVYMYRDRPSFPSG